MKAKWHFMREGKVENLTISTLAAVQREKTRKNAKSKIKRKNQRNQNQYGVLKDGEPPLFTRTTIRQTKIEFTLPDSQLPLNGNDIPQILHQSLSVYLMFTLRL